MFEPSLYQLASYTIEGKAHSLLQILAHYTPAFLITFSTLFDTGSALPLLQMPVAPFARLTLTIYFIAYMHLTAYMISRPVLLYQKLETGSLKLILSKPAGIISTVLISFLTGLTIDIPYYLTTSRYLLMLAGAIIPVSATILFFILFKYPDTFSAAAEAGISQRSNRTYLEGIDIETLIETLQRFIVDQKLYASEQLSLTELAQAVDLSIHQLSELLNKKLKALLF